MKSLFVFSLVFFFGGLPGMPGQARAGVAASVDNFSLVARSLSHPVLYFHNDAAFAARLKLLDMAPAGAHTRIATFAFENGEATRELVRHVCVAVQRGVRVEFLIDSKYGSEPGHPDIFDKSDDKQVGEELLQYMANCGADVYVHNELESYVEVMGVRLPNFFFDSAYEHRKFGFFQLPTVIGRVNLLLQHAADLIEIETARAGIGESVHELLKRVRTLAVRFVKYVALNRAGLISNDGLVADSLGSAFLRVMRDPIWSGLRAGDVRGFIPGIDQRFRKDPVFARLIGVIRRYNRLNHRKLFMVENGDDGCLFVGGRNLGDHYLVDEPGSFYDGDVYLCRGQGADAVFERARASFEDLKTNSADPFLGAENHDNQILKIPVRRDYVFHNLIVPAGLGLPGMRRGQDYEGKIPREGRTLLAARAWRDARPIPGDAELGNARNWQLLLTGWDEPADPVHRRLLMAVAEESREIYLETPYAEFNQELRAALEGALGRGVSVTLVTNSLLTSDGASKMIRVLMMSWTEKMQARYGKLFTLRFTSFRRDHMTHFKGAAFACQKDGDGTHRFFMVGSHNFHPRSGYADKEHMLTWDEPGDCVAPLAESPMVKARARYYAAIGAHALDSYRNFLEEMSDAIRFNRRGADGQTTLAKALRAMLYDRRDGGKYVLRDEKGVRAFFDYLDSSGIHDLLGLML